MCNHFFYFWLILSSLYELSSISAICSYVYLEEDRTLQHYKKASNMKDDTVNVNSVVDWRTERVIRVLTQEVINHFAKNSVFYLSKDTRVFRPRSNCFAVQCIFKVLASYAYELLNSNHVLECFTAVLHKRNILLKILICWCSRFTQDEPEKHNVGVLIQKEFVTTKLISHSSKRF